MNCVMCGNKFTIHTDPSNADYKVISGGRRKVETFTIEQTETFAIKSVEEEKKLSCDPFHKLQIASADKRKAGAFVPFVNRLQNFKDKIMKNDFKSSQIAREVFREEKKAVESLRKKLLHTKKQSGISIPVTLNEKAEDVDLAKNIVFKNKQNPQKTPFSFLQSQSIFSKQSIAVGAAKKPFSTIASADKKLLDLLDFKNANKQ